MAEGVNSTAIVHLPPAATEIPQVLTWMKSVALDPVKAMLAMFKGALPVLVSVIT